jgi:DNA-binding IscR family transcriptional regulator
LPEFVDTALKEIDDRLRALKDQASRLEAARAALAGARRRRGRLASDGTARTRSRSTARRNGRSAAPRGRSGGNTRAAEALELVRGQPGITIPETAQATKIQPNYLYRVIPRLASDGEVKRDGQGGYPASPSSSTTPTARPRPRRSSKSDPTASPTQSSRSRRVTASAQATDGGTARGATMASVLAALAGGEALTASEVASEAGLARPTVSTALSKLAKSGEVQKAERGYRLTTSA